jgi:hypothetical protein
MIHDLVTLSFRVDTSIRPRSQTGPYLTEITLVGAAAITKFALEWRTGRWSAKCGALLQR